MTIPKYAFNEGETGAKLMHISVQCERSERGGRGGDVMLLSREKMEK